MEVTYEQIDRMYREMVATGVEPSLIRCRMLKKTKAVRRVLGRWIRQGCIQRNWVGPMIMKGKSGYCVS